MAGNTEQGAQYSERTENDRARLVDPETGVAQVSERTENERARTVAAEPSVEEAPAEESKDSEAKG